MPPRKPRLSAQARRALELLGGFEHGASEEFLELSGFNHEMLAELVLAGFVTVVTETLEPRPSRSSATASRRTAGRHLRGDTS
jgi:hypothetical protein